MIYVYYQTAINWCAYWKRDFDQVCRDYRMHFAPNFAIITHSHTYSAHLNKHTSSLRYHTSSHTVGFVWITHRVIEHIDWLGIGKRRRRRRRWPTDYRDADSRPPHFLSCTILLYYSILVDIFKRMPHQPDHFVNLPRWLQWILGLVWIQPSCWSQVL